MEPGCCLGCHVYKICQHYDDKCIKACPCYEDKCIYCGKRINLDDPDSYDDHKGDYTCNECLESMCDNSDNETS